MLSKLCTSRIQLWMYITMWLVTLCLFCLFVRAPRETPTQSTLNIIEDIPEEDTKQSPPAAFDVEDHIDIVQSKERVRSKRPLRGLMGYCKDDTSIVGYELNETMSRIHSFQVFPEDQVAVNENFDALIRCVPSSCPSKTYTERAPRELMDRIGRVLGMDGSMYLMNKTNLCAFGAGEASTVSPKHLVPPCFSVSDWKRGKVPKSYLERFPVWIYKPSQSSSGSGIRFVNSSQPVRDLGSGLMQAYVDNPLLYRMSFPGYGEHKVKADLRIFGVVTSLSPLRFYISEHGFFRTGDPRYDYSITKDLRAMSDELRMIHFTNSSPKEHAGLWKNNTDVFEWESASAGSLQRFLSHIAPENNLDPRDVWRKIQDVFARLFVKSMPQLRKFQSAAHRRQRFMTFFADAVIDQSGHAWLYEIHTGCSLKPRGMGGPSSGTEKIVAWETRQATWGSMWMGLAPVTEKHLESPTREWIFSVAQAKGVDMCSSESPHENCVSDDDVLALTQSAQEEYVACSQKQIGVFPGAWRPYANVLDESDVRFYQLWETLEMEKLVSLLRGGASCPPLVS